MVHPLKGLFLAINSTGNIEHKARLTYIDLQSRCLNEARKIKLSYSKIQTRNSKEHKRKTN